MACVKLEVQMLQIVFRIILLNHVPYITCEDRVYDAARVCIAALESVDNEKRQETVMESSAITPVQIFTVDLIRSLSQLHYNLS